VSVLLQLFPLPFQKRSGVSSRLNSLLFGEDIKVYFLSSIKIPLKATFVLSKKYTHSSLLPSNTTTLAFSSSQQHSPKMSRTLRTTLPFALRSKPSTSTATKIIRPLSTFRPLLQSPPTRGPPSPPEAESVALRKGDSPTYLGTTKRLPEFNLVGKVVLVSGAARGLGLVQAEALLEAGAIGEFNFLFPLTFI
jgi:hypothetical protein